MTCRHYGISRKVYYRWLRPYQEQGVEGLRDRPGVTGSLAHLDDRVRRDACHKYAISWFSAN
jgi:transposase